MDFPTSAESSRGVSIVIPAYNYANFLIEAVESALAQDYSGPVEVLIVDDGSTDDTASVAGRFGARVRYHFKDNAGLSAARNTGMELAVYDWVLFLDADDLLEVDAVRRLVAARDRLEASPSVVGCLGRKIDARGNYFYGEARSDEGLEILSSRDFILKNRIAPIVLADRRILLGLGGFDSALLASEDRDMWIRAAAAGTVARLNFTLYRKREHGLNMSRQAIQQTASIFQVLEKSRLDRQLNLDGKTMRIARAVCFYQSAWMYFSSGEKRQALRQILFSIRTMPIIGFNENLGLAPLFRLRFLSMMILHLGNPRCYSSNSFDLGVSDD